MNSVIQTIVEKARLHKKTIALADAHDERVIFAARKALDESLFVPCLIGDSKIIHQIGKELGISFEGLPVINPATSSISEHYADELFKSRYQKGMTIPKAEELIAQPLYYAGMMVREKLANAAIAGSISATADVLRASLMTIGLADGISTASSFFLMILPDGRPLCYADCGVVPNPTDVQLADIAIASAMNFQKITDMEPKIAMLSFSTKGSASHESIEKVQRATEIVRQREPNLCIDGELQFDAAFVPDVAVRKAKNSPVAGMANVFVFPDLNSGNIAYKITERIGGAKAIGPNVQGLKKPYLDLSRGCSVEDILLSGVLAAIMSEM